MTEPLSQSLGRKANRVAKDATLRQWLIGRAFGRWPSGPRAERTTPPYLADCVLQDRDSVAVPFADFAAKPLVQEVTLPLAGLQLRLATHAINAVFDTAFADTESLLALHRFAWLHPKADSIEPDWTDALWRAWMRRFEKPDSSWAWHPYTAAERLINILRFAHHYGLPGPRSESCAVIARHGSAIVDRLEYFGDRNTGNHLANNGRGLFLAGIALGLDDWARTGGRILVNEAQRIFGASGVLREGSSHYHLLTTSWYIEAARAAAEAGRPEAAALAAITERAMAVIPHLRLPGGLPLIGDVSPDCDPERLLASLPMDARISPAADEALLRDGWLRLDRAPWHVLWYVSPAGWQTMPGHGHQDCGSFELHVDTTPIFIDLGRRSYGPSGDADVAASAHNTLTVDGADPYPANKPYYSDTFRRRICGTPPAFAREDDLVTLVTSSFARLPGVGGWCRSWRFGDKNVSITDRIDGRGRRRIVRYLHTPLSVVRSGTALRVGAFDVHGEGTVSIQPTNRWSAYGVSEPATTICFRIEAELPWTSTIDLVRP